MNLGDVATRELDEGRPPVGRRVWFDQHAHAGRLRSGQRRVEVERLVARHPAPVRVRMMAIGHESDDGPERRGEANTTAGAVCPADLDAGRLRLVSGDWA